MVQTWEPMNVRRKNKVGTSLLLFLFFCQLALTQKPVSNQYSILFYNVENLFDCKNDSIKNDDEFLPDGDKRWTSKRMYSKINGIGKTILASNKWETPALIGLCEVENEWVLKQLVYYSPLSSLKYGYIHFESQDKRGIDVALLYQKTQFTPLESVSINLTNPRQNFYTRDALYVKGIISSDTLHIIVNHWPSKRGGAIQSEPKREAVAKVIRAKIDSIQAKHFAPKLIVMGDFNASQEAPSMQILLRDSDLTSGLDEKSLRNKSIGGTYKYQGEWNTIDHILYSKRSFNKGNYRLRQSIVNLPFLIEDDTSYSGAKPKRTYLGPRYLGGVSDHLPIILTIEKTQ
jgi:hypothetical protein